MYAQIENTKEMKSRAAGNFIAHKKSNVKNFLGFVGNRISSNNSFFTVTQLNKDQWKHKSKGKKQSGANSKKDEYQAELEEKYETDCRKADSKKYCIAIKEKGKGIGQVIANSGGIVELPKHIQNPPWKNIEKKPGHLEPFVCAEAHVWADIINSGGSPKNYSITTYYSNGKVAPPCENCKQWVGSAFHSVKQLDTTYISGKYDSKQ